MNINYKIIEVWPDDHQIVVRYTTDIVTEEDVASHRNDAGEITRCRTDVPITLPVPTPTGNELDRIIMNNAPVDFLKTKEAVLDSNVDTSLSDIQSLLNVTTTKSLNSSSDPKLTDEEIAALLSEFPKST
jgi:hypothetical protein